jgi:DNA ligase 1
MEMSNLEVGVFVKPSGAQLRSVPDETSLVSVWEEVGECLGYPKPDGWRFQIHKMGDEVKLLSRNREDWSAKFPSIVQMIREQVQDEQVILDTEVVGFDYYGQHLEPSKLRNAHHYHCYLLDALYLSGRNLVSLQTQERASFIREHLQHAFCDKFTFAKYTRITSSEVLIAFYQECQKRRKEGFDGTILKRLDAPYFTEVLKLKSEDTVDAVVIGAYKDKKDEVQSLLLAVPSDKLKLLIPIAKVARTNTDWDLVWTACQSFIVDDRPSHLDEIAETPDIWITPHVVVKITITELHPGKDYLVRAEYSRKCTVREDKGPEDATSLEHILQIAGLTEIMKILGERTKLQKNLSLFEDNGSAVSEFHFAEDKEVSSLKKTFLAEAPTQQDSFNKEGLIQLRFGLFE